MEVIRDRELHEECGVFGIYGVPNAASLTYYGLHALQHRGQEGAGIVSVDESGTFRRIKGGGLVTEVFDEAKLATLKGSTAIGHVRYTTAGGGGMENVQPFLFRHNTGDFALAHNGNIVNSELLRRHLENKGSLFQSTSDSEILAHLIKKETRYHDRPRIFSIIDTKPEIQDKPGARELTGLKEKIEFRDVHFTYDGEREVIDGISFEIRRGQTVALVGPSGGGKSTLSELLPRFYDPSAGEILIDGISLRDYTQESVRAHMSVVAQDTVLFNDTIENNIGMGKRGATHEEVVEAAKVANADCFIRECTDGYGTNIGDRGVKLSGGQRQRLSIARAVLKNPDILILDEATSALDTESEKLVQDALNNLLKGRTSVVIAHRLSTIHNADLIVVVDHGRIAEQGTHNELMERNGIYAKLIEMQSFD